MNTLRIVPDPYIVVFLLAWPIFVTCPRGRETGSVTIRVLDDSVDLRRVSGEASFEIASVIRNDDSRPLYIGTCAPNAQRAIGQTWSTVFSPNCPAIGGVGTIEPGDSVVTAFTAYGFTRPGWLPQLDPRMVAGKYRLVFMLGFNRSPNGITDPLPLERRASPVFFVKDALP